mgnify:CR=1 FL=1
MKNLLLLFCVLSFAFYSCCSDCKKECEKETEQPIVETTETTEPTFDSIKAYNYGADEYGMKKYVMAFLKKGPNRDRDSAEAYNLQMAHLENIGKMAEAGKLVVAGPFMGDGEIRGIYIFNVESVEEAEALTNTDPAIQAGSLIMELKPWYGSAALMGVNNEHNKIAKTNI